MLLALLLLALHMEQDCWVAPATAMLLALLLLLSQHPSALLFSCQANPARDTVLGRCQDPKHGQVWG
jgi:hypothetical protein